MRKTALLLFIFVSAILQASPVSSRQAAMKAEAFLASRNLQGQTLTLAMQGRQKTIGKEARAISLIIMFSTEEMMAVSSSFPEMMARKKSSAIPTGVVLTWLIFPTT